MINIGDLTITELVYINAFDIVTGEFKFRLDELQNAKIANTQEKTDITGKQGRKLNSLKKNKAVVISGSNGLVSNGMLAIQVGSDFESKDDAPIMWPEDVVVNSNEAVISFSPVGTTGNEMMYAYVKNSSGVLTKKFEQGAETGEGIFTFDPGTKKLTFAAGAVEDGSVVAVYYKRAIKGNVLSNYSDHYSGKVELYVDALAEDSCANIYRIQFHIPKADFNGDFDFEMGDNQTVHSFEAEALAGACNSAGKLWDYTVWGEEAA